VPRVRDGETIMAIYTGVLKIISDESFLDEGGALTLMMMRDGGTAHQRIAAATSHFVDVLGFHTGTPLTVNGDLVPLGETQVIEIN
jgi:hypothetical protein